MKWKPKKKFRPEWDLNHQLCNSGAVLYSWSYQANCRELATL